MRVREIDTPTAGNGAVRATELPPRPASAFRPPRRRRHHTARLVAVGLAVAIVAGLGVGSGIAYQTLKRQAADLQAQLAADLQGGQNELEAGKAALKQANSNHDDKLIAVAANHFILAKAKFAAARQRADSSRLLRQLEGLPAAGPLAGTVRSARDDHTAVDALSDMGVQLALAGKDLADLDGELVKPSGAGQGAAANLLGVVDDVQAKLGSVRGELSSALAATNRVHIAVLPQSQQATFLHAQGTIQQALAGIDQFQKLVPIIVEVVGGNGVRNYLIEQVNPAELRPGGGFIGTYSVLHADHGKLSLTQTGDGYSLIEPRPNIGQPGYVQPPGPIREFVPSISFSFVDSNWYPDFPSNARKAEEFVQPKVGKIDGVISIDYWAVSKMLELTGPITVPGYQTLTAQNFIDTVVQTDIKSYFDPTLYALKKPLLTGVAGPLVQRIVNLQPSQWPALLSALNELAGSRHLQVFFNNDSAGKAMDDYGWSGVQQLTGAQDYMMEVEANLAGTKANYYVTRHYTLELTRSGNTLHHKLTLDLVNAMPSHYWPYELYKAYVRLYVSAGSSGFGSNLRAVKYKSDPSPPGTAMLDGWVNTRAAPGGERIIVFTWDTPWRADKYGREQIYWQKQPGTSSDAIDVIWHDARGKTDEDRADLAQDRLITLGKGVVTIAPGQVGTAQLPSLSLGS